MLTHKRNALQPRNNARRQGGDSRKQQNPPQEGAHMLLRVLIGFLFGRKEKRMRLVLRRQSRSITSRPNSLSPSPKIRKYQIAAP